MGIQKYSELEERNRVIETMDGQNRERVLSRLWMIGPWVVRDPSLLAFPESELLLM